MTTIRNSSTALCRCGASANKPSYDGTHSEIGFSSDDQSTSTGFDGSFYPVASTQSIAKTVFHVSDGADEIQNAAIRYSSGIFEDDSVDINAVAVVANASGIKLVQTDSTYAEEIPFAGHPTLGTALVIREYLTDDRPDQLTLNLGVGEIPVWIEADGDDEIYWMKQIQPSFEDKLTPALIADILGLDQTDIDNSYPTQLVSTGLPTVIVPLTSLDAVQRAETQLDSYFEELIDPLGNVNLLVFAPETYDDNDLNVRVFADCGGVPEDPATGSSNGCLAAYLVREGYFESNEIEVTVEQGYEMNRPSLLQLRASQSADGITVEVGVRVLPVLSGQLQ